MKILFAGSEAVPFASSGGLGDVLGSLPAAVAKEGKGDNDVRVVMPLYATVRAKFADELESIGDINVKLAWRNQYCGIYKTDRGGVKYYFIDNEYYFKRTELYGSFDDAERFAFFGKAVLEMLPFIEFFPDILHANDWQSACAVIYLKRKYAHLAEYNRIRALYTIHNIDYQGIYDFDILSDVFELSDWDRSTIEYNGKINLTKGAIVCADMVSTVSARYAEEIQTEYYSSGLHYILRGCTHKLTGIVNGIDTDYYNPATDPAIEANFTAGDLSGKAVDKAALQKLCGLPELHDVPIVAMVSRLASHKGFDLVCRVFDDLMKNDIQFVLLGTGEHEYEEFFKLKAEQYPDKVCVKILFDKELSKKIYAGADIFLMPSKSEPCGLSQMIASRYGAVPVVRETGGLADTIKPYNEDIGDGNGFTFVNYNAHEMMDAVNRAAALFADGEKWDALVSYVMKVDFSWHASAEKYMALYTDMNG